MRLIIMLTKEVADHAEAQQRVDQIKTFIAPVPDVKITAKTNTSLEPPEEE